MAENTGRAKYEQLSLFPDISTEDKAMKALDQLFQEVKAYRRAQAFQDLLVFIKRFPRIAPFNAFLLHVQKPGSLYVASVSQWKKQFNRTIKPGARPLVILWPFAPVQFVFELGDTEGPDPFPNDLLHPYRTEGHLSPGVYEYLLRNMPRDGISYHEADQGTASAGSIGIVQRDDEGFVGKTWTKYRYQLIVNKNLAVEEKFATITHELGHLFCGHLGSPNESWWPSRTGLDGKVKEFEAETVTWLVCERVGIKNPSAEYLSGYLKDDGEIPLIGYDTVLRATGLIESMTQRSLGRHREPFSRRKAAVQREKARRTTRQVRAQGCLLGQLAGDALGSLVEFQTAAQISRRYPGGVRHLVDGGTWDTIAGQPTDDSEMALVLARMLAEQGAYDAEEARRAYLYWLESDPFDCGSTTAAGLRGEPNRASQANGALMRISPLGIFGAKHDPWQVAEWARQDAELTHPSPVCVQANALFTMAISVAIHTGIDPGALYQQVLSWAQEMEAADELIGCISSAADTPPADYLHQQGWVLIAFGNALWQLLHAPTLEEGVVDTVMRGGDTDTNAAICGALLGAVYGREAVPAQWIDCLLGCRPEAGKQKVHHARPECFWPVDALELAERLVDSKEEFE